MAGTGAAPAFPSASRLALLGGVGLSAGLSVVLGTIAFAALIFPGALADRANIGIGLALFSSVVLAAVVPFLSSYRGMIAGVSEPVAIMGLMGIVVLERSPPDAVVPTLLVAFALSTILTGIFFIVLGYFRWGRVARYIPFPVMGGFLGGVGWLVIQGAFATMTGIDLTFANAARYVDHDMIVRWAPGVVLGLVITFLNRKYLNLYNLPGAVAVGIALFWLVAAINGIPDSTLHEQRLLFGGFRSEGLGMPFAYLPAFGQVDWLALMALVPLTASLMAVNLIATLLTSNAIELSIQKDINLTRELRAAGIATLASGVGGGLAGLPYIGPSRLTNRFKVGTPAVGLIAAFVCLLTYVFGGALLPYLPTMIAGALLIFVGTDQILNWLVASYAKMTRSEYLVVLLVFATVVFVGFMEGVALGVVAGVILFAVNYSRVSIIYSAMTGAEQRSNVDRSEALRHVLRAEGHRLYILELQGFLFFGTAYRVIYHLRDRLNDRSKPPLRYVVLDFRRVNGIDSSAAISFTKLCQYAQMFGFELSLTHLTDAQFALLKREGIAEDRRNLPPAPRATDERRARRPDPHSPFGARVRRFADLDHALEWCENRILAAVDQGAAAPSDSLDAQLRRAFAEGIDVDRFMSYVEAVRYSAGAVLIRQGDQSRDLYFIESGEVSVEITTTGTDIVRLRVMGAGTCVGEVAFYLGRFRSASVVATAPTIAYRLSADALERMQHEAPGVAAAFHEFMARQLAERLSDTDRLLEVYAH